MIYKGSAQSRADVRSIVAETQEAGVKQNHVSGSTLLKCFDANSKEQNIARTMDLISSMDEPMGEVLLSSVAEAHVRGMRIFWSQRCAMLCIRKPELLSTEQEKLKTSSGVSVTGTHTVGGLSKTKTREERNRGVF